MEQTLLSGLQNPVADSTAIFRTVLEAMSRPGQVLKLPIQISAPGALNPSATAILLTLADMDTPVWLDSTFDTSEVRQYLEFYTGCPIVQSPADCRFALINGTTLASDLNQFPMGTSENPDQSATLIFSVEELEQGKGITLQGPGIENSAKMLPSPVPSEFWHWAQMNRKHFPCGIDILFATPTKLAALPRTTELEL